MTPETNQKMLERVRALLAKAEATTFPEEAEAFRAKADEIMTRFAISSFMVEQAQRGVNAVTKPERRDFASPGSGSKFRQDLRTMFDALASHCRCVIGYRGARTSGWPVYGLPSDLDYLDLLFTQLSLEVAKNLQPPVDPNGEVGAEVFKQRQAGIAWPEITRKIYKAGLVTLTKGEFERVSARYPEAADLDPSEVEWRLTMGERDNIKNRLANYNRRYVREHGLSMERNYVKPEVYQRSFMMGFSDEIRRRLYSMTASTRRAFEAEGQGESMALAVRDVRKQALDLYESEFPPPPPLTEEEIEAISKLPKGRRVAMPRYREVTVDDSAMSAGRSKAREVDLSNKPGSRIGSTNRNLPKGA